MRKIVMVLLPVVVMVTLSGCGLFKTFGGSTSDEGYEYSDVYDLKSGRAYVWNAAGNETIYDDIAKVNDESVFFRVHLGDYNFKGEELTEMTEHPRTIWMNEKNDKRLPTVTSRDALIYISDTQVPDSIVFERFGDYGYTIGVANLIADGGDHYYLPYAVDDETQYKYYLDMKSDASQLGDFSTITKLYLDKVGDIKVNKESVTDGGTVAGLKKGEEYVCEFYTGTFYQDYLLKADIHTFCSLERFISYEFEFLHSNCIAITIPDYFKSGYYVVNGVGLFRYVADEDLEAYDKGELDSINWNNPMIIYDEYGYVIYDPSVDDEMLEEISENEIGEGVSDGQSEAVGEAVEGGAKDEQVDEVD